MRRPIPAVCILAAALAADLPAQVSYTVERAVQDALTRNLDIAAARYGVGIAEAKRITAGLRPNPVLSANADHLDWLGTGFDNTTNNAGPSEYGVRADFLVERGKKREARMEWAAADKTLAQLTFEDVQRKLVFDVVNAFIDVQLAKETLSLAKENLQSLLRVAEVNQARVATGDLAVVELNRSKVATAQYQTAVRQAELQLAQAKNRLRLLVGEDSGNIDVTGAIRRDVGPSDLTTIREIAIKQRPDLQGAKQLQARNQADLRLQLSQTKIDLTAGAEYRRQQSPSARSNSIGLYISAPLPIFNKNQGEIARSEQEIAQAKALARSMEAHILNEAAAAWEQYTSAGQLLKEMESDLLNRAKDVRSTTEYSYRRGEASLIEFLDAQRAFNDTVQSYNSARADYARALYLIDTVMAARVAGQP